MRIERALAQVDGTKQFENYDDEGRWGRNERGGVFKQGVFDQ